jgi:FkbM family methyltransferase
MNHPIGRRQPLSVFSRLIRWQLGSRILGWPVVCPFVNQKRLIIRTSMTGATMNLYVGLHEFEDMGFILHALRPDDVLVDVGANVGVYSILAGGCGAKVIAIEPVPSSFDSLEDNIYLNRLEKRISALNIGLASKSGTLRFTTGYGSTNHVVANGEGNPSIDMPVKRLDDLLREGPIPTVIKIDVEGYEIEVIAGAQNVLTQNKVMAVIMELNGLGRRYSIDNDRTDEAIRAFGFAPAEYNPFQRTLSITGKRKCSGNTLYIRCGSDLAERLQGAPAFNIFGILV